MRRYALSLAALVLVAACASSPPKPTVSMDPPGGTWAGDYGPSPDQREQISVELRWEGANLRGAVRVGVRSLALTNASFKPDTGAITMEFDAQGNGGQLVHYVVEGKVAGNTMTGNWTHDSQRGDFKVTKQ